MIAVIVEADGTETQVHHSDMPASLDYQMSIQRATAQRIHDEQRMSAMRRAGLIPAVNADGSPVRGRWGQIVVDQSSIRKALR